MREQKLERFRKFCEQMLQLPQLGELEKTKQNELLWRLYRAANFKMFLERAKPDRDEASELRRYRKHLRRLKRALEHLIQELRTMTETVPPLRECFVNALEPDKLFPFLDALTQAVQFVVDSDRPAAALIHPALRSKAERALVPSELTEHIDVPRSSKSPKINLWFIGAAADCLNGYRTEKNKRIRRYDIVISELFKAAFGDSSRNDENIRVVLRRQQRAASDSWPY